MDASGPPPDPLPGPRPAPGFEPVVRRAPPSSPPGPAATSGAIGGGLGVEIRRWLAEADGRLGELEASPTELPRADDFGHLTSKDAKSVVRSAPAPSRRAVAVAVIEPVASERHGIFVASGWGTRLRAS